MTPPRHRWTRALAALAVASVVCVQSPVVAQADNSRPFDANKCIPNEPTKTGVVPTAWQVDRLKLGEAWQLAEGEGIEIAVIDTGTSNVNSPYLNNQNVVTLDYLPKDEKAEQEGYDCNHGTMVTSMIVGARGKDPRTPFAGVAPKAKVYAMRVLKGEGQSTNREEAQMQLDALIRAINDAVARKVDIINISQAMSHGTPQYEAAIKRAVDAGIVVVAAAGNRDNGITGPAYPAAYPGVIAVGMSLPQDTPSDAAYDNADTKVAVAAPGEGVTALIPSRPLGKGVQPTAENLALNQAYATPNGTSFAAPLVTGLVALMLERNPGMSPAEVKQRLIETADPPPVSPPDSRLGFGVINPLRALTGAGGSTTSNPKATVSAKVEVAPPKPVVDHRPRNIALLVAGVVTLVTLVGGILRLTIPPAAKRGFKAAQPKD